MKILIFFKKKIQSNVFHIDASNCLNGEEARTKQPCQGCRGTTNLYPDTERDLSSSNPAFPELNARLHFLAINIVMISEFYLNVQTRLGTPTPKNSEIHLTTCLHSTYPPGCKPAYNVCLSILFLYKSFPK